MCGIFAYLGKAEDPKLIHSQFQRIKHRGPDDTETMYLKRDLFFGFHRLAINGLDESSNQPLQLGSTFLMCNGEIYNFHHLQAEHGFHYQTRSDCEVILHLYQSFGFEEAVKMLDGVFAIILYDEMLDKLFIANDPIGIRPLYWGFKRLDTDKENQENTVQEDSPLELYFASEPCALSHCDYVDFFPPGSWTCLDLTQPLHVEKILDKFYLPGVAPYFSYDFKRTVNLRDYTLEEIYARIRALLTAAVEKRMMSDRPIASLLSGGLDSSLIAAIIAQELRKSGKELEEAAVDTPELIRQQHILGGKLHTFSIGMPGSPDLKYAQMVADHIGSEHHHVEVSEEDFLEAIPEVVKAIQSWDITTVRASVGNYLIAKYIQENTLFTVIFNGDVSEEINASYSYSRFAPSSQEFFEDNVKLLREVHQYDVLRSARCVEHHSLEARTPFADKDLVNFIMSIEPCLKMFGSEGYQSMEKYLIRKAFDSTDLLPKEVLWRPKEAFSDGVSQKSRSWHDIIREWAEEQVTDEEFLEGQTKYAYHYPPPTKEAYFYRKMFEEILPGHARMIKAYWMPRFIDGISDPSARVLPQEE